MIENYLRRNVCQTQLDCGKLHGTHKLPGHNNTSNEAKKVDTLFTSLIHILGLIVKVLLNSGYVTQPL